MRPTLSGILVIDKPGGWTSHDVIGWVRKWSGERKVGHGGTLDPAATGVLPVALNDGTRMLEYLSDTNKTYEAEITFGIATDSCDGDGTILAHDLAKISQASVSEALVDFRGPIQQRPPAHSAIRIYGRRAYEFARTGEPIEMPLRSVEILNLELLAFGENVLTVSVECTKGTYIRSLARDLGERLGTCAYLSNLVRTRSGPYDLCDVWTISQLEESDPVAEWESIALHPDSALPDWSALVFGDDDASDWLYGRSVKTGTPIGEARCRVFDSQGRWLGLAEFESATRSWRALRVIGRP